MQHFDGQYLLAVEVHFEESYSEMKIMNVSIGTRREFVVVLSLTLAIFTFVPTSFLRAVVPTTPHAFHVETQWNVGGKGGWGFLCLDVATHRLYIPRTDHVMVVDTETGKVSGAVEGLTNIRDIALDDSGKYGYVTDVTDGTAGFVRVFDRFTLKLVASIPTGRIPDAIIFDPGTKAIFAFNSRGHSATVIDSANNEVITTIALNGRPGSAVTDGRGGIFVALPALGEIARIDAATKKIEASWQLAPCTGPGGLTIDNARRQLFTVCEDHKLVAINADTGHITPIGDVPASSGDIRFDSKHNTIFIADASGTLTIFHRDSSGKYSRLQTVKTQPGARTMTVDPQSEKAYLVTSQFGQNTGAVSEELQFRPTPIPGTFAVTVVGR
jgi:DNA-binding beta-propeller fold protein YncE